MWTRARMKNSCRPLCLMTAVRDNAGFVGRKSVPSSRMLKNRDVRTARNSGGREPPHVGARWDMSGTRKEKGHPEGWPPSVGPCPA